MNRLTETRGPELALDDAAAPLTEAFTRSARERGAQPFLTSLDLPEESRTFASFDEEARRVAAALVARGLKPGDRVSILSENRPRWCVAYVAILHAGGVAVPIDAQLGPAAIHAVLADAGSRALFVSAELASRLPGVRDLGWDGRVLSLDDEGEGDRWSALADTAEAPLPEPRGGELEVAILYTSGTTGSPKGVVLTHANMRALAASVAQALDFRPDDRMMMFLPLQHVLSQIGSFIVPAALGLEVVHAVVQSGEDLLAAVRKGRVTILLAVPLLFHVVHERIERQLEKAPWAARAAFRALRGLNRWTRRWLKLNFGRAAFGRVHELFGPQLRFFASGGSALDRRVQRDFQAMGFDVIQAYGMTETTGGLSVQPLGDLRLGLVGRALPGATLRIDRPSEDGVGEVCAQGPMITPGYHGRPDATAELLEEGWLHTGDLGRLHADGSLEITGRIKEVIVLGSGKNIYPEDLEAHYARSPWVAELCVMGHDSGDGEGEKLHAVVVPDWDRLRSEGVTAVREVLRFELENLSAELPPWQRVLSFDVRREPLPRTATRKLQRFLVEPEALSADGAPKLPPDSEEQRARLDSEVGREVVKLIRGRVGEAVPVQARASFELDLGLDSLNRMEALLAIEQSLGVQFEDEEAARLHSVDELLLLAQSKVDEGAAEVSRRPGGWSELLREASPDDLPEPLRRRRGAFSYALLQLMVWTGRLLARMVFRLRVEGRENMPAEGPFLICPNHVSYLDGFLVSAWLTPRVVRHAFVLGEADYVSGGLAGRMSAFAGIVPTNPNLHLRQSMRAGAAGLKDGRALMIFPEGTRSADGRLQELKLGAAILATELDLPIVPAVIEGAFEAWPRSASKPKWFTPCRVRFGEPLRPAAVAAGLEGEPAHRAVNEALRRALVELGAPVAEDGSAGRLRLPTA